VHGWSSASCFSELLLARCCCCPWFIMGLTLLPVRSSLTLTALPALPGQAKMAPRGNKEDKTASSISLKSVKGALSKEIQVERRSGSTSDERGKTDDEDEYIKSNFRVFAIAAALCLGAFMMSMDRTIMTVVSLLVSAA
jgi:hypothetical protein